MEEGKFKDDYEVGAQLGSGAFGEVRRCVHKVNRQVRAVKAIKKARLEESEKELLFAEIEVLKELDHPNIIKVFEVYEDEKRFYIVTELVKGGELFDKISEMRKFDENIAAEII